MVTCIKRNIVYCHFFSVKFLSSGPELVKVSPNILINSSMSKDIHSNNVSFLSSHIPNVRVNPIVYSVYIFAKTHCVLFCPVLHTKCVKICHGPGSVLSIVPAILPFMADKNDNSWFTWNNRRHNGSLRILFNVYH